MSAGDTHNPGSRVSFRVLGVRMIESSEATTRAHLLTTRVSYGRLIKISKTNLFLISEAAEVFAVRIPCNKVRISGSKFWILLVA